MFRFFFNGTRNKFFDSRCVLKMLALDKARAEMQEYNCMILTFSGYFFYIKKIFHILRLLVEK